MLPESIGKLKIESLQVLILKLNRYGEAEYNETVRFTIRYDSLHWRKGIFRNSGNFFDAGKKSLVAVILSTGSFFPRSFLR